MKTGTPIPEYYKTVKLFSWDGDFYYNQEKYEKTTEEPEGEITDKVHDYPAGNYYIYENGVIDCTTIMGKFRLKKV